MLFFLPSSFIRFVYKFVNMDRLTKEQRRKNMQAIKAKNSKIENRLAKSLFALGYRYRKNDKKVFGKPDITFKRYRIAIFCDSEFWHGKDWETQRLEIKSNKDFWYNKIESNINRDKLVNCKLKESGWTVIRFWGKEIENNLDFCVKSIIATIKKQQKTNDLY